ncbi:ALDH-like protein [Venturia nashicola]|uniref:ALDH-like protein n=1 Tax=Venturia nashicola TaxID=86259 RepID=A0A4Z1P9Q3_9PEZI|nr:ALDH-like protein [Venturia nashicola]
MSGSNGTIAEITDRIFDLFSPRQMGSSSLVNGVRSLDNAIDLANRIDTLLTSYIFASPSAGKYVSQFVAAPTIFVNHVPIKL